jgi:hypothetical protein
MDTTGAVIWKQSYFATGSVDPSPNTYPILYIDLAWDPTTSTIVVALLYSDIFTLKYSIIHRIDSATGSLLGSSPSVFRFLLFFTYPVFVAVDSIGRIYLAGTASLFFSDNPFLEEYSPALTVVWNISLTGFPSLPANYLTITPTDSPLLSLLSFLGTTVLIEFNPGTPSIAWALNDPLINTAPVQTTAVIAGPTMILFLYSTLEAGYTIYHLASVSYAGSVQSVIQYPGLTTVGAATGLAFARAPSGRLFVSSTTTGSITGGTNPPPNTYWLFIAEIATSGNILWSNQTAFFNPGDQRRDGMIHTLQATATEVWLTYRTTGTIAGGTKTNEEYDTVVAKFRQIRPCTITTIPLCCPTPLQRPDRTTVAESDYVLGKLSECPLILENGERGAACDSTTPSGVATLARTPLLQATAKPTDLHIQRTHHRVRRIEDVARFARPRTASGYTARLRTGLANYKPQRHAEHYRAVIPLPPCPVPFTGNPGVPIAPQTPCNEGFQSVDYSNPRA